MFSLQRGLHEKIIQQLQIVHLHGHHSANQNWQLQKEEHKEERKPELGRNLFKQN